MTNFDIAYFFTSKWEKGIVDHPKDPGGLTKNGISIKFLKAFANKEYRFLSEIGVKMPIDSSSVLDLTEAQEQAIYKKEFWDSLNLGTFPVRIGVPIFDASVNSGQNRSIEWLQESCNQLSNNGKLVVDGKCGPLTLTAVKRIEDNDQITLLAYTHTGIREKFLQNLSTFNTFGKGWMNRTADLRKYIATL